MSPATAHDSMKRFLKFNQTHQNLFLLHFAFGTEIFLNSGSIQSNKSEKMFFSYLEHLINQQEELQIVKSYPSPSQNQSNNINMDSLAKKQLDGANTASIKLQIQEKSSNKRKKDQSSQQYIPNQKEIQRKVNYVKHKSINTNNRQYSKRRMPVFVIDNLFDFLQTKEYSYFVVSALFSENGGKQISNNDVIQRFYDYQKLYKRKKQKYLMGATISYLNSYQDPHFLEYSESEQTKYLEINRILIKYFLQDHLDLLVMTSRRISRDTRSHYFEYKRKFQRILITILENHQHFKK